MTTIHRKISQSSESGCECDIDSDTETILLVSGSTNHPKDWYHFVSFSFMLLGLAALLPWCFFTTATDYWMYKFRNTSLPYPPPNPNDRTDLQATFGSWLSIASSFPAFFMMLISTRMTKIPEKFRNGISQIFVLLIFITTTAFIYVDTDKYQKTFFAFTMVLVVVLSVSGAIFQSGVVGLAAMFPRQYMHSMVTGQAIAGVFAACAQILSMVGSAGPSSTAMAYFLCAIVGLILTFICYIVMRRMEFFKYYATNIPDDSYSPFSTTSVELTSSRLSHNVSSWVLFKEVWTCALCIAFTFTVTISVLPSMVNLIVSSSKVDNIWTGRMFLPVTCFLLFNFGDLCGRLASGFFPLVSKGPNMPVTSEYPVTSLRRRDDLVLLVISVFRVGLVPLLMFCNAQPRTRLPVLFEDDRFFIAIISVLGFSNGFLFCGAMLLAPKFVPTPYQERVGSILTVFLGVGLTLGALLSFPMVKLL